VVEVVEVMDQEVFLVNLEVQVEVVEHLDFLKVLEALVMLVDIHHQKEILEVQVLGSRE
jgi:hypothetical protein